MNIGVKETLCTKCGHRAVCSFKDDFLAVQRKVDDLDVGVNASVIRVIEVDWLNITVSCKHFTSTTLTR